MSEQRTVITPYVMGQLTALAETHAVRALRATMDARNRDDAAGAIEEMQQTVVDIKADSLSDWMVEQQIDPRTDYFRRLAEFYGREFDWHFAAAFYRGCAALGIEVPDA